MKILTKANLSAFVVRFWFDGEHGEWHGHVTHIETQQYRYFISMDQLEEFIIKFLPINANSGHLTYQST